MFARCKRWIECCSSSARVLLTCADWYECQLMTMQYHPNFSQYNVELDCACGYDKGMYKLAVCSIDCLMASGDIGDHCQTHTYPVQPGSHSISVTSKLAPLPGRLVSPAKGSNLHKARRRCLYARHALS